MNNEILKLMKVSKIAVDNFHKSIYYDAKKNGISKCEAEVLLFFYENPKLNAKDAVFNNHVSKAYVSKAISLLLKKNLITIYTDETDRRYQKIIINDNAKKIIDSLINTQQQIINYLIEDINVNELKMFLEVVNKIEDKILNLEERKFKDV